MEVGIGIGGVLTVVDLKYIGDWNLYIWFT